MNGKRSAKFIKRASCVLLTLCLVLSLFCMGAAADTRPTPIDPDDYWGRTQLQTLSNGKALVYAYDQLADGIENCEEEIFLSNSNRFYNYYVSEEEFDVVLNAYLRDYPHHFWMGNQYSYKITSKGMYSMLPQYTLSGSALTNARSAFNNAVEEVMQNITVDMTEQERERYLHDYLAEKIVYTGGLTHSHNAYGALVEGKSVCEGYAESFQYLLYQSGIMCVTVTGNAYSTNSTTPEAHAWSLVKIDGDYYYVDLTWNDQDVGTFYAYYNITEEDLERDHILDTLAYDYPACTATKNNYFAMHGGVLDSLDTDEIADGFHKDGNVTQFRLTDPDFNFWSQFNSNRSTITNKANVIGTASYKGYTMSDVFMVVMSGQMRGDVNADTVFDQNDLSDLFAHCTGAALITDNTLLKAADVNQDGKVDIRDHQRLYENVHQTRFISPTGEGTPTDSNKEATLTLTTDTRQLPMGVGAKEVVYTATLTPPSGEEIHSFNATVTLPAGTVLWESALSSQLTDRFETAVLNGKTLYLSGCQSPVTAATELFTLTVTVTDCSTPKEYTLAVTDGICASSTANHTLTYTCNSVAVVDNGISDQQAAQFVIDLIDALNTPVTLNDADAVEQAGRAYDALTDDQKALVTNYKTLTDAEQTIVQLKEEAEKSEADKAAAKAVTDQIGGLPNPVTLADDEAVILARKAYNALTYDQKALVTNLNVLAEAEQTIVQLKEDAAKSEADKAAAQAVVDLINALTPEDLQSIAAARAAYNGLTDTQKQLVTNLDKLEKLENPDNDPPSVPTVLGDVDGDDKTTAADALMVLKSVVGKVDLAEDEFAKADLDQSGKVDAADALLILKIVVGKYIPA